MKLLKFIFLYAFLELAAGGRTAIAESNGGFLVARQYPDTSLEPEIRGVSYADYKDQDARIYYSVTYDVLRVKLVGPICLRKSLYVEMADPKNEARWREFVKTYYSRLMGKWLAEKGYRNDDVDVEYVFGEKVWGFKDGDIGLQIITRKTFDKSKNEAYVDDILGYFIHLRPHEDPFKYKVTDAFGKDAWESHVYASESENLVPQRNPPPAPMEIPPFALKGFRVWRSFDEGKGTLRLRIIGGLKVTDVGLGQAIGRYGGNRGAWFAAAFFAHMRQHLAFYDEDSPRIWHVFSGDVGGEGGDEFFGAIGIFIEVTSTPRSQLIVVRTTHNIEKYLRENRRTVPYELVDVPDAFSIEGLPPPPQKPPQKPPQQMPTTKHRRDIAEWKSRDKRAEDDCIGVPDVDLRKFVTDEEVKITVVRHAPQVC